jgi:hypothetical protein
VMSQKLLSLTEQEPDFGSVLELARALREQIDWAEVRRRTAESPFADAYFVILDRLEIVPATGSGDPDGGDSSRVRVEVSRSGEGSP